MRKIIILYLLTGLGHFREAEAVEFALREAGHEVELVDPLDYYRKTSPGTFSFTIADLVYRFMMFWWAFSSRFDFFAKVEGFSESRGLNFYIVKAFSFVCKWAGTFFSRRVNSAPFLDNCEIVVSIHPITSIFALGYRREKNYRVFNVIADEIGISAGQYLYVEGCETFVNSQKSKETLLKLGADGNQVQVIGHPLHPTLVDHREQIFKRVQTSISQNQITLGLFIGLFKPAHQQKGLLGVIRELKPEIESGQIKIKILTCGHKDFEAKLAGLLNSLGIHQQVKIYNSGNPADVTQTALTWVLEDVNVMFSRPSELVFYSLGLGIPHILFDPVGPQEVDMMFLLKQRAGVKLYKEVKDNLAGYLQDSNGLLKVSSGLYGSNYPVNGANEILKYLN